MEQIILGIAVNERNSFTVSETTIDPSDEKALYNQRRLCEYERAYMQITEVCV